MKRLLLTMATAALLITSIQHLGSASGPFDQRLSQNQQIVQALNRLTFGPRPGDMEEVRRMGWRNGSSFSCIPIKFPKIQCWTPSSSRWRPCKWILREIVKEYTPGQPGMTMAIDTRQPLALNTLLSDEQRRKVLNGTAEERTEVLKSLDADKRKQVLPRCPRT